VETIERQQHWQHIYATKGEREVSWFQNDPQPSLGLIEQLASVSSAIIDIGGGASRLAGSLLERGFRDLTVLDVASSAITAAKSHLGRDAEHIQWIIADVTSWQPARHYDIWHDRATFHFLVTERDRAAYIERLTRALMPGGFAIIATFAPDGPAQCSGLPVVRYDANSLHRTIGAAFTLESTQRHVHITPWGTSQAFQYSIFRRLPGE
jgi:2-polyprenyl-3-methyl-5-hydroxy-6-metoxy-1,4-benzoquinol methylase